MIGFRLRTHALRVLFCFLSSFAFTGCGAGSGAAVEGSITLDGKPVDGGLIAFVPIMKDKKDTGRAMVYTTIKEGKYTLAPEQGPLPGQYRVDITWKKKTGKQIPANDSPQKIDQEIQVIPAKYNVQSATMVEIKSSGNKFDYAISSREWGPGGPGGRSAAGAKSLRD